MQQIKTVRGQTAFETVLVAATDDVKDSAIRGMGRRDGGSVLVSLRKGRTRVRVLGPSPDAAMRIATRIIGRFPDAGFRGELLTWDRLTTALTGFASFADMLDAKGNYRPTLRGSSSANALADAYDQAQELRGDARRAYR